MTDTPALETRVYVMAHADDAQLFMQPDLYRDLTAPETRVVFIVTTAGDGGMDENYWRAREEGLKSSLRFCLAPLGAITEKETTVEIEGRSFAQTLLNQHRIYCMRLPDGGLDGEGFEKNDFQSLPKLRKEEINRLTALDQSATYEGWGDFCEALRAIIHHESAVISLHYLSPNEAENPGDHPDHAASGAAVQNISGISHVRYMGYSSKDSGTSLKPEEFFWKAGMFATYEKAVYDAAGYSTLREGADIYTNWTKGREIILP